MCQALVLERSIWKQPVLIWKKYGNLRKKLNSWRHLSEQKLILCKRYTISSTTSFTNSWYNSVSNTFTLKVHNLFRVSPSLCWCLLFFFPESGNLFWFLPPNNCVLIFLCLLIKVDWLINITGMEPDNNQWWVDNNVGVNVYSTILKTKLTLHFSSFIWENKLAPKWQLRL